MNLEDIKPGMDVIFTSRKHRFFAKVLNVFSKPAAVRIKKRTQFDSTEEVWIVQPSEIEKISLTK